MSILSINNIHKTYDRSPVLRGVSLEVEDASITALLGPSGCGKTTLLRIVAGLEQADAGSIIFAGQRIDQIPAHQRGFGMMFQDYALFPHLDVAANVAFGLRMQGMAKAEQSARINEVLELVGLGGYGKRRVYALSGGERQRVALARALAPRPRLLMLDEPLAALDRALRERLQEELRTVLRQVGVTALYVTHDQEEAFALTDQVVLLNAGRVEQAASPQQIYQRPASLWAAQFLGLRNRIPGVYQGNGRISTALGELHGEALDNAAAGSKAIAVIAPDAATAGATANSISGELSEIQFRGRYYRIDLRGAQDTTIELELEQPPAQPGAALTVGLNPQRVLIYPV